MEHRATENVTPSKKLFSFLALLKTYIPDSYLLMSECQQILGPPDPIYGYPPFGDRIRPYADLISTSDAYPEHVHVVDHVQAQEAVEQFALSGISRSNTVKNLIWSPLCGNNAQPHLTDFIKDLLTKREMGTKGRKKFSRFIEDILEKENFFNAVSVLKAASQKFHHLPIFPQTISCLFYISKCKVRNYDQAEKWAKTAIGRDANNSYVSDTLGQVYKNRLLRSTNQLNDVLSAAQQALQAFEDVERKAETEMRPFNNRGAFGFIQVAKITYEKLNNLSPSRLKVFIEKHESRVEAKFLFFEWYLAYSKPDIATLEPHYFWKDVALCYRYYTRQMESESTSFAGLLDCLNHGLFTSRGRCAGFNEERKTLSELEEMRDALKTTCEENEDDVDAAERYILSNIVLNNRMHIPPQHNLMRELQTLLHKFLNMGACHRSPEFYLLVLLLFWPERQLQVAENENEGVAPQASDTDGSWNEEDSDDSDDKQDSTAEPAELSLDLLIHPDLQKYATEMEKAFENVKYAKYLHGRYLLPLFFLGREHGLRKWVHKSTLDAIVEDMVDTLLTSEQNRSSKEKWKRINEMWSKGRVWQIPEIRDSLLPVQGEEPCQCQMMPGEEGEREVLVCCGGMKLRAKVVESDVSGLSPMLFYLGFTIKGPVVFKVPHTPDWCEDFLGLR